MINWQEPAPRLAFKDVISHSQLLGPRWKKLSEAQQVVLKLLYGMPLEGASEQRYWSIFSEQVEYDELGYPRSVAEAPALTPHERHELWCLFGRRSGKTSTIGGFTIVYEALFGGHLNYVEPGQPVAIYLISETKEKAIENLSFVDLILKSTDVLASAVEFTAQEEIRLANGIIIKASQPSIKAQRGLACPVLVMDEIGFWASQSDSANPDVEVVRALDPSQLQFPHFKRLGLSTPWTKTGLLWEHYRAGTGGAKLPPGEARSAYADCLVLHAPTAAMGNPLVARASLERRRLKDPQNFEREFMARFIDAVAGFLPRHLVEAAISPGLVERAPRSGQGAPIYVAAIDPAFRSDSFAAIVGHRSAEGVEIDWVGRWEPPAGGRLNPLEVLTELVPQLKRYNVLSVISDQFQQESFHELAQQFGIFVERQFITRNHKTKVYANLYQLFTQGKIKMPDPALGSAQHALFSELLTLEKVRGTTGNIKIQASKGFHDDMCDALALMAHRAMQMPAPAAAGAAELPPEHRIKKPIELGMATLERLRSGSELLQPFE